MTPLYNLPLALPIEMQDGRVKGKVLSDGVVPPFQGYGLPAQAKEGDSLSFGPRSGPARHRLRCESGVIPRCSNLPRIEDIQSVIRRHGKARLFGKNERLGILKLLSQGHSEQ